MDAEELRPLIDLAEGAAARLNKASSLLTVLRSGRTSTINDEVMHEYLQTVQDLVDEAQLQHQRLWHELMRGKR